MTVVRRLTTLTAIATSAAALALAATAFGAPAAPAPAAPAAPAASAEQPGLAQTVAPNDLAGTYQSAVEALRALGMDPFLYPTAAAFCSDATTLGLVPAVAGAIPGPWPKNAMKIPGLDLTAVEKGEVMFTFVPYGVAPDTSTESGMRVAWVNLKNGRSGLTSMGPLSDIFRAMVPDQVPAEVRPLVERAIQDFFFATLPAGGIRAVPVDTGSGTVLAAVFGTVENDGNTCFFLPTIGITTVK
ncbi:hypothetical protein ACLMAL_09045 [Nocardia sp. CWNU-33]|uniref:hypothetical protein n=1 Tax=Nocardia sp. CWNU-33 TaxID=3392117 RepID=UPI00398F5595